MLDLALSRVSPLFGLIACAEFTARRGCRLSQRVEHRHLSFPLLFSAFHRIIVSELLAPDWLTLAAKKEKICVHASPDPPAIRHSCGQL
jgi:hypothetical protein